MMHARFCEPRLNIRMETRTMTATLEKPPATTSGGLEQVKFLRRASRAQSLFAPDLLWTALKQAFAMLRPDIQWKNPVMFVVEVGTVLTFIYTVAAILQYGGPKSLGYIIF